MKHAEERPATPDTTRHAPEGPRARADEARVHREASSRTGGAPGPHPGSNARNLELAIDELVLHGFSRYEQRRISSALESELGRLLSERVAAGDFSREIEIARIDGGAFTAKRGMSPEKIGREIARAIVRGMK
jgi:hypothetical protein